MARMMQTTRTLIAIEYLIILALRSSMGEAARDVTDCAFDIALSNLPGAKPACD
jgi:hypothetical protein